MNNGGKRSKPEASKLTRRNFLGLGLGVLSTLAVLEIGGASVMFLRARSLEGEYGGTMTAGAVEDFPPGSVTEFEDGNFFLVRASDGGFLAIYRRCPHLGCTVKWVEDKERFYCPCHASSFDKHGDFIDQPVPRALDAFSIEIEDDCVQIDTSKLIQRETFSPDELVYG
jgi:cytochrome b6-f complex iron-sulfur subunit